MAQAGEPRREGGGSARAARAHLRVSVPSPLIHLCLKAAEDPDSPYLVILDEMNLARVEYYFSDFLSALESGKSVPLFDPAGEETETDIPSSLPIPDNVLFVGRSTSTKRPTPSVRKSWIAQT
jgi:5-methylcytosine-specific restriction endonuclease McrBC GTP-binding regulatory subunit McrB